MALDSTLADISNPNKRLTSEQLISLSNLDSEELAQFEESWAAVSATRRHGVIADLTDLAADNVELNFDAVFEVSLADEEELIRAAALRGLHENERPRLARRFIQMLRNDPAMEVRREAAVALGRFAMAAALDQVDEALGADVKEALFESAEDIEEDELVRARAIEAAGAFGGEDTENLIESIYREEDNLWLRVGAVDAMGRSAEGVWLPLVCAEMENLAPEMRHAAAFAAGEIGDEAAIDPLRALAVEDPDREVQLAAVNALGEIAGDRAKVALQGVLYEGDDELAGAVQEALERLALEDDPLGITG